MPNAALVGFGDVHASSRISSALFELSSCIALERSKDTESGFDRAENTFCVSTQCVTLGKVHNARDNLARVARGGQEGILMEFDVLLFCQVFQDLASRCRAELHHQEVL